MICSVNKPSRLLSFAFECKFQLVTKIGSKIVFMDTRDFLTAHNQKRYQEQSPITYGDSVRIQCMQEMVGSSKTILDVGCWDGLVSRPFVKMGCHVLGLDNSSKAVDLAKLSGLEASVAELDQPWPIENQKVDAIVAGEVIEHVVDIDTFLSEACRVLKYGGLLIISTPNLAALGRRLMLLLGINPHIEISFARDAAGHVRYFTPRIFIESIESKGFKLQKFTSDVVNFNATGSFRSAGLARLIPSIGRSLIGCFKKK